MLQHRERKERGGGTDRIDHGPVWSLECGWEPLDGFTAGVGI